MGTPQLIIVSGPPGSGKTTLARELSLRVGSPLVARDAIKEGLVAATPGYRPAPSDALADRANAAFFASIELLLRAGVTLVAEAAFQHRLWAPGLAPMSTLADLVVLRCQVPAELARVRGLARVADQPSRAAHADAAHFSVAQVFDPLDLPVPTLDVDTSDGWRPGLDDIVTFIRSASASTPAEEQTAAGHQHDAEDGDRG